MKDKKYLLIVITVVLLIGSYLLGVHQGKSMIDVKIVTHTKYIKGDTIHDSISVPKPYQVLVPSKIDSIGLLTYMIESHLYDYLIPRKDSIMYLQVDTMAIVKEFLTKNSYSIDLFDNDTIGHLTILPEVQYNKLITPIHYKYTPIIKEVNTVVTKRESKYLIGVGIGLKNTYNAQIGYLTKSGWGATLEYERMQDYNTNNFKLNVIKGF
jgi:hypothetical protein